jgi:hypothetical protein
MKRCLFAAIVGLLFAGGSVAVAGDKTRAAPSASAETDAPPAVIHAEVIVLHATNSAAGIDPKIGRMPELEKPPFSAYDSYKLLDRAQVVLTKGNATTTKLPNGSELMVTMKAELAPAKKGEPKKYVVSASIRKEGGSSFLPLLEVNAKPGDTFFVAGQKYQGGILVIGIKIQ